MFKIKLKLGVCTVHAQYVVAGEIKRRTFVFYDPDSSGLISSRRLRAAGGED